MLAVKGISEKIKIEFQLVTQKGMMSLMLDVFVLNASVCTVKTCSQTSSSETWEREGQLTE